MIPGLKSGSICVSDDGARIEACSEDADGLVHIIPVENLTSNELWDQVHALCVAASEPGVTKWTAGCIGTTGRWWIAYTETFESGSHSQHWSDDLKGILQRLGTAIEEKQSRSEAEKDSPI
jgi:hypothetical protein